MPNHTSKWQWVRIAGVALAVIGLAALVWWFEQDNLHSFGASSSDVDRAIARAETIFAVGLCAFVGGAGVYVLSSIKVRSANESAVKKQDTWR